MEKFRESMSSALSLKGSSNYSGFAAAIKDATSYSSALFDSNNFANSRDMRFAQAVAANQFESLESTALDQIDYLQMIEENTRAQVTLLSQQISDLGKSVDMSSAMNRELIDAILKPANNVQTESWFASGSGNSTWISSGGAVATGLENNSSRQMITGKTGSQFTTQNAIDWVNTMVAQGDLLGIYNRAVAEGISSTSLDAMMGWDKGTSLDWAIANNLPAFAEGGLVKGGRGGVIGLVGEKNYDELITPLKDSNDPLGLTALIAEIRALRKENEELRNDMNEILGRIESNTQKSRGVA
jgi:hypothetical protein